MLHIGLTGGIGSGKSTVARRLVARGALLVDADVLAREVLAPGTDGLAAVVAAFGEAVLGPDGSLDRSRLAAVVFGDEQARRRLNGIVHPRVRDRAASLVAAAPADAVVVQDVPLLVEGGMVGEFALVVVVLADAEERVRRLVRDRGMPETDARSRIAAQADDAVRRAAADARLDNGGTPDELTAAVDDLWDRRLRPFAENLRTRRVAPGVPPWVAADSTWGEQAGRLRARITRAVAGRPVEHVGATAVPGLPAADVLELHVGVEDHADRDVIRVALADAGFPPVTADRHGAADPGRAVDLRVLRRDSVEWVTALGVREWLCADGAARAEYRALVRTSADPIGAARRWWDGAGRRAEAWAHHSGGLPR